MAIVGLIFLAGFFLPVQVALNSRLGTALNSPVRSSIVSFLIGLAALLLVMAVADARFGAFAGARSAPSWAGLATVPWWAFLGGLCGAFYVLMSIVALPRLGATVTIALALMGQQVASIVIDTFGLFGAPRFPLTWHRLVGVLLVAAGVLLVQQKNGSGH